MPPERKEVALLPAYAGAASKQLLSVAGRRRAVRALLCSSCLLTSDHCRCCGSHLMGGVPAAGMAAALTFPHLALSAAFTRYTLRAPSAACSLRRPHTMLEPHGVLPWERTHLACPWFHARAVRTGWRMQQR